MKHSASVTPLFPVVSSGPERVAAELVVNRHAKLTPYRRPKLTPLAT